MIERDFYLQKLIRSMWNGEIKVITGIRRCGKSVLLFDLFGRYLLAQGVAEDHILRLALDQRRFYRFRNPVALCDYVEGFVTARKEERFFLFVDEVQMAVRVKDEAAGGIEVSIYDMLNELRACRNLDVYVTGSNSKMLSRDVATEFRGRATQIHLWPLSFAEFYAHTGGDRRSALDQYMVYGGMPRITTLTDEGDKKAYLRNLFDEIYLKDMAERNRIAREDVLNDLLDYMASQIGSLSNPTGIANALSTLRRERISSSLISSYLSHVRDAFLVEEARRYDVKGKAYFHYPNKYYYTDPGLRNARLNFRQFDPGHLMENIVYNDLVRRGYAVDVGVVTERTHSEKIQREIDFVVNDADRRIYIQSAWQMGNAEKEKVELKSLHLTGDFFKKIVVRMDIPHRFYDEKGIFHCSLMDFLLDDKVLD